MDFMLFSKYPIIPVFLNSLQIKQQEKITIFFLNGPTVNFRYTDKIQKKATCT